MHTRMLVNQGYGVEPWPELVQSTDQAFHHAVEKCRRSHPQIYTYLRRRTRDRELSEDPASGVFVRALARIGAFTWRGSDFGAWPAAIARNPLPDHCNSSRHRREVPTGDMRDRDVAVTDLGEQASEHLARADVLAERRKAPDGLTPDQWECPWLRYWHNLPFGDIGERMDRSMPAAKMLKERAPQSLSAPDIKAALLHAASGPRTDSPSQACAAPQTSLHVPSPRRPAPSNPLDSGRTHPVATPHAIPATLPPLTADQAIALVLLRDGLSERSITQRTGVGGDTLYRLAATHGITAPHGTVEGHHCHEAADTEPCDGCSLAAARDQARARARQRRSVRSLPRTLRRQAAGPTRRAAR